MPADITWLRWAHWAFLGIWAGLVPRHRLCRSQSVLRGKLFRLFQEQSTEHCRSFLPRPLCWSSNSENVYLIFCISFQLSHAINLNQNLLREFEYILWYRKDYVIAYLLLGTFDLNIWITWAQPATAVFCSLSLPVAVSLQAMKQHAGTDFVTPILKMRDSVQTSVIHNIILMSLNGITYEKYQN